MKGSTQAMNQNTNVMDIVQRAVMGSIESVEDIDPKHPLLQSGLIDSLALVQIVMAVQNELGVTIEVDEIDEDNFQDIESIADLVSRKM